MSKFLYFPRKIDSILDFLPMNRCTTTKTISPQNPDNNLKSKMETKRTQNWGVVRGRGLPNEQEHHKHTPGTDSPTTSLQHHDSSHIFDK